jgi:hypothetical protein
VEARAAGLEPRFREFKHDMHWRQSRDHAAALHLSRAEEAIFELEEMLRKLEGDARQLRGEIEEAEDIIGSEAIARGRERRMLGARPPTRRPPVDGGADFADWLLSRMPL